MDLAYERFDEKRLLSQMSRTLELRDGLSARENKKNHGQYVVSYNTNLNIQVVFQILPASTPLPHTENDKKKDNQETKIQEVPGNRICYLAVFTGAGSSAEFWRGDPEEGR